MADMCVYLTMEPRLSIVVVGAAIICLLQPQVSGHKTRIIVRVPHLIKHVHHTHYKPFHIHSIASEKFEHHYHDGKESSPKHKEHGSFSNIKPIIWHQGQHKAETSKENGQGDNHNNRAGGSLKNNNKPFKSSANDQWRAMTQYVHGGSSEEGRQRVNENWVRYEGAVQKPRKSHGFSRGFRQNKKHLKTEDDERRWEPISNFEGRKNNFGDDNFQEYSQENPNPEKIYYKKRYSGPNSMRSKYKKKPNQQYNNNEQWGGEFQRDNTEGSHFIPRGNNGPQTISQPYLKEDQYAIRPSRVEYQQSHIESEPKRTQPERLQHQQQSTILKPQQVQQQKVYKKIEPQQSYQHNWKIYETNSQPNIQPKTKQYQQTHQQHQQTHQQHQQTHQQHQQTHQQQSNHQQTQQLQQYLPQITYLNQNTNYNHQETRKSQQYTNQQDAQQSQQYTNQQDAQQSQQYTNQQAYQHQKDNHQQIDHLRLHVVHNKIPQHQQTQQSTSFLPKPNKMIISEQKLQTPQHTMWFVQQHSSLPAPAKGSAPSHVPVPSASLPNPQQPFQAVQETQQLPQVSLQEPKLKQQWHQSVQTSGKDGPASSYKVEVINYSPLRKTNPLL